IRLVSLTLGLALIGFGGHPLAAPKPPQKVKLDTPLRRAVAAGDESPRPVIVRSAKADRVAARMAAQSLAVSGTLAIIDAMNATMTASQAAQLAEDTDVDGISEDVAVHASGKVEAFSTASASGLELSGTEVFDGDGVGVAVIDSGIDPGPDFEKRITAFYD